MLLIERHPSGLEYCWKLHFVVFLYLSADGMAALTIGIPEKKAHKVLQISLCNVSLRRRANYFITCKFESAYNLESTGRAQRTEVQKKSKHPEFKNASFGFKLVFPSLFSPIVSQRSDSRGLTVQDDLQLGTPRNQKGEDIAVLEVFEVSLANNKGGSAKQVGVAYVPLSRLLSASISNPNEKLHQQINFEKASMEESAFVGNNSDQGSEGEVKGEAR